jgi:hypothetical protein
MHRVNTRLVFAVGQWRRLENEAVPLVVCPPGLSNVGTRIRRHSILDELIIDVELDLDSGACTSFVDDPSGHSSDVRLIQPAAQTRISGYQIKAGANRRYQQCFRD